MCLSVAALATLGAQPARAEASKMDTDGDGFVSLEEFKAAKKKMEPEKAEATFKRLDKDKDGKLSPEEAARKKGAGKPKPEGC